MLLKLKSQDIFKIILTNNDKTFKYGYASISI